MIGKNLAEESNLAVETSCPGAALKERTAREKYYKQIPENLPAVSSLHLIHQTCRCLYTTTRRQVDIRDPPCSSSQGCREQGFASQTASTKQLQHRTGSTKHLFRVSQIITWSNARPLSYIRFLMHRRFLIAYFSHVFFERVCLIDGGCSERVFYAGIAPRCGLQHPKRRRQTSGHQQHALQNVVCRVVHLRCLS